MTKDGRPSLVKPTAVQVALRIRPITDKDRTQPRFANLNDDDCLKVLDNSVRVTPHNKIFNFDHVFGPLAQQEEIFSTIGENLIHKFIEGYNVTILAYGQTSSGKTYTMGTMQHNGGFDATEEGIVPRAMSLMFDVLQNQQQQQSHEKIPPVPPIPIPSNSTGSSIHQRPASPTSSVSSAATSLSRGSRLRPRSRVSMVPAPPPTPSRSSRLSQQVPSIFSSLSSPSSQNKFTIKVSFVEIYNEELIDLLNDAPIEERPPIVIREDPKGQIYWTGVREVIVNSSEDVLFYLEQGTQSRATGATDMNEKSSRSHAIFSVTLQQEKPITSSTPVSRSESPSPMNMKRSSLKNLKQDDTEYIITSSKFHFVDLAGSERLKRTAAKGDRRKEGININAGLLALGNVISALGDSSKRGSYVPYRDSKLTRLLQDSLGGNATTLMIACVSPIEFNLSETLNTLHYANRARNIKNRSEKNEVEEWMTTENLELLRTIISKLKNEVNILKSTTGANTSTSGLSITPRGFDDDLSDDVDDEHRDIEQVLQEQRLYIADLQHQIEELDGQATVTHERNKVVEAELHRLRKLDMLRNKKKDDINFEHLVEPVIEEYEKSIAKLESELSVTRAALNQSDFGIEDLQTKCDELQRIVEHQQETMSNLQSRFSKVSEREESNAAYIEELETKLEQSAIESKRYQNDLSDLRTKVSKWKENEEKTEDYIHELERRLAISEENQLKLTEAVEELERQRTEQSIMITKLKRQSNRNSDFSSSQQQLMLSEIDQLNAKCTEMEKERDDWMLKAQQHHDQYNINNNRSLEQNGVSNDSASNNNNNLFDNHNGDSFLQNNNNTEKNQRRKSNRRSLADEQQAVLMASTAAELRAEEQQARAEKLEQQLKKLDIEHKDTIHELNEIFQRYQEALSHVEHLENTSMLSSTQIPFNTIDSQPSFSSSTTSDDNNTEFMSSSLPSHDRSNSGNVPSFAVVDQNHHHHHNPNGFHLEQEMLRGQDQEHRNTIAKLEKEIGVLNDHVAQHRDSLEVITLEKNKQADSFSEYISELKNTVQRLETESEEAHNKIRSLQHAADDHDDLVERTVFKLEEVMERNEDLLKQYATTKSALETLQQKHRSIIEEKASLTNQLEQLQNQHDQTLQLHTEELVKAKDQVKEHSDLSMQQLNELEVECNQWKIKVQDVEEKLDEQKQNETTLLNELSQTQNLVQEAEKEYKEKINQLVQSMDEERQSLKNQIQKLESEAKEKDLLHASLIAQLGQEHQEKLEKEKADVIKQVETKWLERESEWKQQHAQNMENLTKEKDDHHQLQLKEIKKSHLQILDTEKSDAIQKLEATLLERESEWEQQHVKNIEALVKEKDDQHQLRLREIKELHLQMLDTEKSDALQKLESRWLERESEWKQQIQQLEALIEEKENHHQQQLKELSDSHLQALDSEKTDAIQQLENKWLERQSEWNYQLTQLQQDILEKEKQYKTDIEAMKSDHHHTLENEKEKVAKETETIWLKQQTEWQDKMNVLEKEIQDKNNDHASQIKKLVDSHEKQLEEEKNRLVDQSEQTVNEKADKHKQEMAQLVQTHENVKKDSLEQVELLWLERQSDWEQQKNHMQQDLDQLKTQLEEEKEKSNGSLTDMKLLLEKTQQEVKDARTDIAEYEELLDEADKNIANTTAKLEQSIQNERMLESVIDEAVKENEATAAKLKLLEDQHTEFTSKREVEQGDYQMKNDQVKQQLEEKSQECIKHQEEIAFLKSENYSLKIQSDQYLSTKNEIEQDYQEKMNQVKEIEQQLKKKNDQCLRHQKEIAGLKINLDQHASSSSDNETLLQQLNTKLENAEKLYSEKQKEYDLINEKYKEARQKVDQLENKLSGSVEQYDKSFTDLQAKLELMEQQYTQDKENYESNIQQLKSTHQEQLEQITINDNNNDNSTLQRNIHNAQAHTEELYEQLQKDYEQLKTEHQQQLSTLLEQHEQQMNQLKELSSSKKDGKEISHDHLNIPPSPSLSSSLSSSSNDQKEKQRLIDENEEYAELTKTLEQELDRVTQELDKLVIETNENEITIQEQLQKIQRLKKEKAAGNSNSDLSRAKILTNDNETLKKQVSELELKYHEQKNQYLAQVQELEQKSAEHIDQMTQQQQQIKIAWDKDKQEKDKLTRQVKVLEEKIELLLQDKKKFLCF